MSVPRLSLLAIPILGIMTGNAALSLDMYLPAFPAIAQDFAIGEAGVQITMSTFLAGFAIGQAFYGPLSDTFGRRPVILVSLLIYGLISALCAMSGTIDDLIIMRALQGLAGASGSVLGRAVIRDVYDGPRLAKAMSMLMLVLTAAPMAAPMLGSVVLDLWHWRGIFWTLSAYACLWSMLIFITIPETLRVSRRVSIRPSAVMLAFAQVLGHKRAMGYTLTAGLGFAGMFVYLTATPFIYMEIFDISPRGYALFFAANIAAMATSTFINGRLVGRLGTDRMLGFFVGVLVVSSIVLLATGLSGFGGVWGLAVPLFFYVGSLSPVAANCITGTLQFFGHTAGTASSVFGVVQFGIGSVAGWVVSIMNDATPAPMVYLIIVCALLSACSFWVLARERESL
ncbi:MAG: Bcr/CflA family multidrug efflux MFS transporter [Magnetovibrio sp.]|nr:Bcr/CflA family multidrug efflux MFS transporter [Magnetovibrio sp.]